MAEYGYQVQLFPNLQGEMFTCSICLNIVRRPKECSGCGDLFCGKCIDDWTRKNSTCPKRCTQGIKPMSSPALIRIYESLDMKCPTCSKIVMLGDFEAHRTQCGKPKCFNNDICNGFQNPQFNKCCSERCQTLQKLLNTKGNVKAIYQIMKAFKPNAVGGGSGGYIQPVGNNQQPTGSIVWDKKHCGQGVQFENNSMLVILKEPAYVFRTSVASHGFTSGLHYWEIIPDSRTENELKIGVTTTLSFDFNTAFCDHVFGFAYYGLGQLRHGSNASGPQYGKRLKKEGVLGIFLNMDKGQLSFSLNGESMGVAFENVALKKGPIYPAVALLHCAGCTIKGELPVPYCFK